MAIKSKNTDSFKGLISWCSLILMLCSVTVAVLSAVEVILNPAATDYLNDIFQYQEVTGDLPYTFFFPALCLFVLFALCILFVFLFRRDRLSFQAALARFLSRIWVEFKLLIYITVLLFCFFSGTRVVFFTALVLVIYFLCLDVGHNRHFFSHNIVHSLLRALNDYRQLPSFEQRSTRRLFSSITVIISVLLFCSFCLASLVNSTIQGPVFLVFLGAIAAFCVSGIVGTVSWYTLALRRDLKDWNVLMAQIAEMYGGNLNAVNHIPPTSNLYDCAMQLNMIRTGIQKAVEEGTKADRTKVELITNVSHDIKTPLTSIISYVELLKKEPDLPDHVMDYVNTISGKAARLSSIVQDVFEVSKAATGNISLHLEDLDMGKLLKQTFAEMSEVMEASGLHWNISMPDSPALVHADGQRLYRVFQNLVRNCAQYSLEGSRVYVNMTIAGGTAQVSIRNISRMEIQMNGDDLTARFVRGDQNRTSEGSGLGLSIAKSFTEACGGSFTLRTEDDLFLVIISFPTIPPSINSPVIKPEHPVEEHSETSAD